MYEPNIQLAPRRVDDYTTLRFAPRCATRNFSLNENFSNIIYCSATRSPVVVSARAAQMEIRTALLQYNICTCGSRDRSATEEDIAL
jgi:hypothetical protein